MHKKQYEARDEIVQRINNEYKNDFKALEEHRALLKNVYSDEELKKAHELTCKLRKEIGKPGDEIFDASIESFLIRNLAMTDPISQKFVFYIVTNPEDIKTRANIAKYISKEDEIHFIYYVGMQFLLLEMMWGAMSLKNIVHKLIDDYFYYKCVDVYFLSCLMKSKDCPNIQELREKLRRERRYQEGDYEIYEKKIVHEFNFNRNLELGYITERVKVKGNAKIYEMEIETLNDEFYEYIDDEFCDGFLCGGIELGFPRFSDIFWGVTTQLRKDHEMEDDLERHKNINKLLQDMYSIDCQKLIVTCKGKSKIFKMTLFSKYQGMLVNTLNKGNREMHCADEKGHIQDAVFGLAKAAKEYKLRKTETIEGHLQSGVKENLRKVWEENSTTQNYDERLEVLKYNLTRDGLKPGSEDYEKKVHKFQKNRGKISKSKLEHSGGAFLQEEVDEDGNTITIEHHEAPKTEPVEESLLKKENKRYIENTLALLRKKHPELAEKLKRKHLDGEEDISLSAKERQQLSRFRGETPQV